MANDSTSPTPSSSKNKSSAAYLKRREQVRRAQRTHRERKETYIHVLESEVLALRTKARSFEEQNDILSAQVRQLQKKLDEQIIESEVLSIEWAVGDGSGWSTSVGVQQGGGNQVYGSSVVRGQERWPSTSINVPAHIWSAVTQQHSGLNSWSLSASHAEMAMEFVLTLEKPCMMWAQTAVFDPLNAHPSEFPPDLNELIMYHSFVEDSLTAPDACTQEDIASGLDNLLKLSSALRLEHEVTPIQAWQHLREYFELGVVDLQGFRKLADMLLEHVLCYGFGAVIPRNALDAVCNGVFTGHLRK